MSEFYIEKVIAKGSGKEDSVVELKQGLNIIQGRSNTGKSLIIKCIDFCFGSKSIPFDKSLGYDTIALLLHTAKGHITITRKLGKNQVQVETDILGHESGPYDLVPNPNKKEPLPILSDLLLFAIGIEEEHKVIKNKNFERKRLTWRTFLHLLLFSVKDIANESSIIEPEQATARTLFYSSLLFLLTGNDFADTDAQTEGKIRKIKKQAVEEYVNKKISDVAEQKKALETQLSAFDGIDVEQAMQDVIDSLKKTEEEISDAVKASREIFREIVSLQSRSAECELLLSRYASLRSQYVADIKRLSFIVDGEVELEKVPQNHTCPFCDGKIPVRNKTSYIASAQAELNRIASQMNGLTATEQDVISEQKTIAAQLEELTQKRNQLEQLIAKELQPKADAFRESLNGYRAYIQVKKELDVIAMFADSWTTDLQSLPTGDESTPEFHPKEHFGKEFQEELDKLIKTALTECCYENLTASRFNMKDFDIEVNGHKKSSINGQGYTSYLNSIIAFVFRQYMSAHAKFDPGFLVIDTPILGLDQGVDDAAPESMRTALFRFFTNHQNDGQVIILENIVNIPDLDYVASGANVITFTRGLSEGRYGFLNDVQ